MADSCTATSSSTVDELAGRWHAEKIKGPLEGQHHQEALCGQSFAQTVQYGAEVIARGWLAKGEGAAVLDGPAEAAGFTSTGIRRL